MNVGCKVQVEQVSDDEEFGEDSGFAFSVLSASHILSSLSHVP